MKKKRLRSLTVGLPLLFVVSVIIIMIVVVPLVYHQFYRGIISPGEFIPVLQKYH